MRLVFYRLYEMGASVSLKHQTGDLVVTLILLADQIPVIPPWEEEEDDAEPDL